MLIESNGNKSGVKTPHYPQLPRSVYADCEIVKTMKRSRDHPQNNRDLNKVILHLWSKFGDRVMSYHVDKPKAKNWVEFDFEVKFDLQGQGQSLPKQ